MALYSPDTIRRRGITPFVSDDDAGIAAPASKPAPTAAASMSSFGRLKRNVQQNASKLGDFFASVRRVANREPGTKASVLLGRRLAAGAAAASAKPQAIASVSGSPSTSGASTPVLAKLSAADAGSAGAAGTIPVAPNIRPAAETGVTLADGRKLPYGTMVNGVPTFSDGTGGVPRTMSDAEIAGLGDRLPTVPAGTAPAGFAAPQAFNSPDSEANIASLVRSRQGGKFGITPEMNAAADLAAVTNQDPRTTLGRAALNASRRANAASTTLQRKAALGDLAGLREGVIKNAALGIDNAAALDRTNVANRATLQRQALANTGALDQQALQNEGELNRTDLAGQYGVESALAGAQARTGLTEKDVNAGAIKLLPQVLGLNAAGMIDDPNAQGGMRQPTEQEIAAAMQRAKAIIRGGTAPPAASTAKPTLEQFLSAARARNPGVSDADLKAYYTKTYGG